MNTNYFNTLFEKYRNKGLLIDSNLLLLYIVGSYSGGQVEKFKRTRKCSSDDFDVISQIVNYFSRVITTPNILTEVSNLSGQLPEQPINMKVDYFQEFAIKICGLDENYEPSREICKTNYFKKFGLTDSGIISLSKSKYLVLTDDFPLVGMLEKLSIDVINFNHIRIMGWKN